MKNLRVFNILIKSGTDAPDYEGSVLADSFSEAQNMFYEELQGEYSMDEIAEFMEEN